MVDLPAHHRRSIRLKDYDYTSEGGYFITLVTHERENLFGEISNGEMCLNDLGIIARYEWFRTATMRPYVELFEDEFIVMPNHIHGIIWITSDVGAYCNTPLPPPGNTPLPPSGNTPLRPPGNTPLRPPGNTPLPSGNTSLPNTNSSQSNGFHSPGVGIGAIVRGYKSAVTKRINQIRDSPAYPVWQRNYYEHIISTDHEYETTVDYIYSNPQNWNTDKENPPDLPPLNKKF
jgi:REP element-mobilizing transposase RayT